MKIIVKLFTILLLWLYTINVLWYVVTVPNSNADQDVIVNWSTTIQADESTLFELIQIINKYLWFSIWAVCMVVLIIWWIKLMSAQGDGDKVSQSNRMLFGAWVGIMISIFSYAAVRLIVNLFG